METQLIKYVSIRIRVPETSRNALKAKLALQGITITEWGQRTVQTEIST